MEFLKTSWIFKIQSKQYTYNVNLCVMGGKIIKTIQTNFLQDIQNACQDVYSHYDANLDNIPEYSKYTFNLVVTKQCWLRHVTTPHTLNYHSSWVHCVAFHPLGQLMVSGSYDKTLRVWDTKTWDCIQILTDHSSGVSCVAFHPSGQFITSGSDDKTLRVWDTETWNSIICLTDHSGGVWCVAFHPSGKYMVSGSSDKTLQVWNTKTWTSIQTLTGHSDSVWCVAFHPLGGYMVSGSCDKTLRVWE
jgi:WD40 repeat protein